MRNLHRSSTSMKNRLSWPQPVTFFIILTIGVLLLPGIVIPYWYRTVKDIKHGIEMEAVYDIASKIDSAAKLILPIISTARAIASMFGSAPEQLSFSDVQSKVAPALLEALLITPHLTQTSYIGLDGLFYSYYKHENNQIYAAYSNTTFASSNSSTGGGYTWYTQSFSSESGELYGEVNIMEPSAVFNETWFQSATNTSNDFSSLGCSWTCKRGDAPDLFLDTAKLGNNAGVVSVGFGVQEVGNLFSRIDLNGGNLYMATVNDPGTVLLQGMNGVQIKRLDDTALVLESNSDRIIGQLSCKFENGDNVATSLKVGQSDVVSYCSKIDIARVPLMYVIAVSGSRVMLGDVLVRTKMTLILLIVMMVSMVISIFAFVGLIVRAGWREVQLCAAYMRQMDKTAQAERKTLKQSLAFASANHDIRGYLACIKGLLDLCYNEVQPSSELASNFKKIDACTDDLLEMVNSILDFSKIEAGKMQLEKGEFNLERLLEDMTDLHHPVASKKGVEVILDPCDGSVVKFSSVIGDRGKLKQILTNLLSNAVKYTPSGHISVRAWAKKPSLENSIVASNRNGILNRLFHIFDKNEQAYNDVDGTRTINEDSNCMEFVFEVDDSGLGIPKDKRKSIFEDFVQVKENSIGQVGTGLGLGIVQALVRLMGGDIEIVDKVNGEEGTCFRFNVIMTVLENASIHSPSQHKGHYRDTHLSSEPSSCGHSPRIEGSIVALLMKNDERRRVIQRYVKSLGIKVVVVRQVNRIPHALKKKVKGVRLMSPSQCYSSSSGSSAWSPRSPAKLLPLSSWDGANDNVTVPTRSTIPRPMRCLMLILDANAGDFLEMCRSVALLRKENFETCIKVVWLERPETRHAHFSGLSDESLPPTDCIIQEPLHGRRLFSVVELLPEFGGELIKVSRLKMSTGTIYPYYPSSEGDELFSPGVVSTISRARSMIYMRNDDTCREVFLDQKSLSCGRLLASTRFTHGEIEQETSSSGLYKTSRLQNCSTSENTATVGPSSVNKPLVGKTFLIAEDYAIGRKIASSLISNLGGHAEVCENGQEAVDLICKALNDLDGNPSSKFSYDYVLMDCQMPIMDGFEATRRIRQEERKYGIHIPVIALTADEIEEAGDRISEAGMDVHITKPLKKDRLLEVVSLIRSS